MPRLASFEPVQQSLARNLLKVSWQLLPPVPHFDPNNQSEHHHNPDKNDKLHDNVKHSTNHLAGVLALKHLGKNLHQAKQKQQQEYRPHSSHNGLSTVSIPSLAHNLSADYGIFAPAVKDIPQSLPL